MSMIYDIQIFPLFTPRIKLEVERSLFNNDKTMKVWGLKNAKIAGRRNILIIPTIHVENTTISINFNIFN